MRNFLIVLAVMCSALDTSVSERQGFSGRFENLLQGMDHPHQPRKDLERVNDGQSKAFPCPDAADIAPCVCIEIGFNLYLDCTDAESDEELEQVFQQYFPVREFFEFQMHRTESLVNLNFTTNGVSFENFIFSTGPFSIQNIADEFFADSALDVTVIDIESSQIGDDGFPFASLSNYPQLDTLQLTGGQITEVPRIVSFSLSALRLSNNQIASVEPGAFDGLPNVNQFLLSGNQLTAVTAGTFQYNPFSTAIDLSNNPIQTIEAGTFFDSTPDGSGVLTVLDFVGCQLTELGANTVPITAGAALIDFAENSISVIDPTAFVVRSEPAPNTLILDFAYNDLTTVDQVVFAPLMPYVSTLFLEGNSLECGCDVAWLMNSVSFDKISPASTCADGTPVSQLNPEDFLDC